jgi:hypothetical protein
LFCEADCTKVRYPTQETGGDGAETAAKFAFDGGVFMKIERWIGKVLLLLGLMVGMASAQTGGVRAKVPFDFSVAGKRFAAGEYMMVPGSQRIMIVSLAEGKTVALALANAVSGKTAGRTGRVVFRCYRQRCFLQEVWSPTQDNGLQVLTSPAEREQARVVEGVYFAVLGQAVK